MRRRFSHLVIGGFLAAILAVFSTSSFALEPKLDYWKITQVKDNPLVGIPTIAVEAEGYTWKRIVPGDFDILVKIDAKMKVGVVASIKVDSPAYPSGQKYFYHGTTETERLKYSGIAKLTRRSTKAGFSTVNLGHDPVKACNTLAGVPDRDHIISVKVPVAYELYTHHLFDGKFSSGTVLLDAKIICRKDTTPFIVTKAKLSFVEKSERDWCPKYVTSERYFETNKPGKITYLVERKDGKPHGTWTTIESQWNPDKKKFIAVQHDSYYSDGLDEVRRLKIKDGLVSPWEEYKVVCPPFKVEVAELFFKVASDYQCPREVTIEELYKANGPGVFRRRGERKGGKSSEWKETKVKLDFNTYVAKFVSKQKVGETLQVRRVTALWLNEPHWSIHSNWVPMVVNCLDIEKSSITFKGPATGTCKYQTDVDLRVQADMLGNVPYQLDCTDGQTRTGTFKIGKAADGKLIGTETVKLDVAKSGKQICALKADVGAGFKSLTLQGKDFECKKAAAAPPEPELKTKPAGKPANKIVCRSGTVENGKCLCPSGWRRQKIGAAAYRCTRPLAACEGGKVVGGKCRCPRGQKIISGKCVKPAG